MLSPVDWRIKLFLPAGRGVKTITWGHPGGRFGSAPEGARDRVLEELRRPRHGLLDRHARGGRGVDPGDALVEHRLGAWPQAPRDEDHRDAVAPGHARHADGGLAHRGLVVGAPLAGEDEARAGNP